MTDCTPIESGLGIALSMATEEANGWRGRCVNLFARAEFAVGGALLERQPAARMPMLVGQKVQRLSDDLNSPEIRKRLDEFAALLADRTALTHGRGKPWVDKSGSWLLTLEWVSNKGLERRVFTAKEAMAFHQQLRTAVQRVEAALKST